MTFQQWLAKQIERPDQVGHLSFDTKNDKKWPKTENRYAPLAKYLMKKKAAKGAQQTLRVAFIEWALQEKLAPAVEPKGKKLMTIPLSGWLEWARFE